MALQLNLPADQTGIGIPLPAVYARVMGVTADDTKAQVSVNFYADAAARAASAQPVSSKMYEATGFDLINPIAIKAWIYGALKTLPDFAGAVDV